MSRLGRGKECPVSNYIIWPQIGVNEVFEIYTFKTKGLKCVLVFLFEMATI